MTLPASALPTIAALMQRRAQLLDRAARVAAVTSLEGMAALFGGTGLQDAILTIAQTQVTDYLQTQIADLETQITAQGVDLHS